MIYGESLSFGLLIFFFVEATAPLVRDILRSHIYYTPPLEGGGGLFNSQVFVSSRLLCSACCIPRLIRNRFTQHIA
jgi:hypothetical protein